jgi:hypothetical protein
MGLALWSTGIAALAVLAKVELEPTDRAVGADELRLCPLSVHSRRDLEPGVERCRDTKGQALLLSEKKARVSIPWIPTTPGWPLRTSD